MDSQTLEFTRSFCEALGFDLVSERHGTGVRHQSCNLGDVVIELYPTSFNQTSNVRPGLRMSKMRDAIHALTRIGSEVLRVDAGGLSALVRDPDGHEIALQSASRRDAT